MNDGAAGIARATSAITCGVSITTTAGARVTVGTGLSYGSSRVVVDRTVVDVDVLVVVAGVVVEHPGAGRPSEHPRASSARTNRATTTTTTSTRRMPEGYARAATSASMSRHTGALSSHDIARAHSIASSFA